MLASFSKENEFINGSLVVSSPGKLSSAIVANGIWPEYRLFCAGHYFGVQESALFDAVVTSHQCDDGT